MNRYLRMLLNERGQHATKHKEESAGQFAGNSHRSFRSKPRGSAHVGLMRSLSQVSRWCSLWGTADVLRRMKASLEQAPTVHIIICYALQLPTLFSSYKDAFIFKQSSVQPGKEVRVAAFQSCTMALAI